MNYTEQRENAFWSSDPDSDDIHHVLEMLNSDFRTFGEALLTIIEKKEGQPITDPIDYLKTCCSKTRVPLTAIGSISTLKNWFSGKPRPKKGVDSRKKMFALSFALQLTVSETQDLFHKAYLDRAFNQRDYNELIYYYCISHGLPFTEAESLIAQVQLDKEKAHDITVYTSQLISDAKKMTHTADLLAYIHDHAHNFSLDSQSAKQIMLRLKDKALSCAQAHPQELRHKRDSVKLSKALKQEAANELHDHYHSMDLNSDSFLYSAIMGQRINGTENKKGTTTLPIANTQMPKEIKNNFPQVKSLSSSTDSFEELRKVIILLFSYEYWYQSQQHPLHIDEKYDQYTSQLDSLLWDANLPPLYYGNPFDWLFLYCSAAQQSLDTFQEIIAEILEDTGID